MSAPSRILVASNRVTDADLVGNLLRGEFDHVTTSTDANRAVEDFENTRPNVLVLTFNGLQDAEQYYLGLYRRSTVVHAVPHRTVILCNMSDLRRVYELCKKQTFDDYVQFWPMTHDAPRLLMAVHHALRRLAADATSAPTANEFAIQARRLATLESLLEQHTARGNAQLDIAHGSLQQAQQNIGLALDGFSHQLSHGDLRGLVDIKHTANFQHEFERLKKGPIATQIAAVATAVQPIRDWNLALRHELAPQIDGVRVLQTLADRIRPRVLAVDDDEFQHTLLRKLMPEESIELCFASSATEALMSLNRRRPDLILMDVDMPGVDGIEATRRIKGVAAFASIPVLMATGHSDKEIVVRSKNAGAAGFVVKPFNRATLLAKMRVCLQDAEAAAL